MIHPEHLRLHVIRPALRQIGLWSEAAEDLLLGTAAVESNLGTYLVQIGGGPALSPWQIEPATHADLWINFLAFRDPLASSLQQLAPVRCWATDSTVRVSADALLESLTYAAAVARLVYRRAPEPLPAAGDWWGFEAYHKKHYNTLLGKTRPGEFIVACKRCKIIDADTKPYTTGDYHGIT